MNLELQSYIYVQGTYTLQEGTELSTPQGGTELSTPQGGTELSTLRVS